MEVITDLRALRRALEGGAVIERIVCPAGQPYLPALYRLIRRYGLRVQQVPRAALPQGATWGAAYLSPIPFQSVEAVLSMPPGGLLVALVGITDVRNVGAIVRNAAAFAVKGLLWPTQKVASPANPDLWRASAGTLTKLPIYRSHRVYSDLQALAKAGWSLVATTKPSPKALSLSGWSWPSAVILLLGSEEKGLPPAYLDLATYHLTIPHNAAVESLNVGSAAAILLWHYYQQNCLSQIYSSS